MSRLAFTLLLLAFIALCALAAGFTREQPPCAQGASSVTYIGGVASAPERTGCP